MKEKWETFRFTNDQLQSSLIKAIDEAGLVHKVREDGTILYTPEQSIEKFIEQIIDTVFTDSYYRADIPDKIMAERYRQFKKFNGTEFIEENRSGNTCFVQKGFEKLYRNRDVPTHISFILVDENLIPDRITEQLGITPTFSCIKGGHFTHPHSKRRKDAPPMVSRLGRWELCSIPEIESNEILTHIEWLLEKIEPISKVLQSFRAQLAKKDNVIIRLDIVISRNALGHVTLSSLMLNRLSKICDMLNTVFWPDDYI